MGRIGLSRVAGSSGMRAWGDVTGGASGAVSWVRLGWVGSSGLGSVGWVCWAQWSASSGLEGGKWGCTKLGALGLGIWEKGKVFSQNLTSQLTKKILVSKL